MAHFKMTPSTRTMTTAPSRSENSGSEPYGSPESDSPTLFLIGVENRLAQLFASMKLKTTSFASPKEFLAAKIDHPGCVICDVMVSTEISGFQLLRLVREQHLDFSVILVSAVADMSLALRAVSEGAVTLLSTECDAQLAMEAVNRGLQQNRERRILNALRQKISHQIATLNDRETQVLKLVTDGFANKQIAAEMRVSLRSVEKWRKDALDKLGIDNPLQLLRMLMQAGFQSWPDKN